MYIYTCTYIHILLILHVSNITLGHRRFVLYTAHRFLGFGLTQPRGEAEKSAWSTAGGLPSQEWEGAGFQCFFLLLLPHVVWIPVFMRPLIYSMILWIIHYHILWHLFPRNQRLKCRNCTCLLPLRFDPFWPVRCGRKRMNSWSRSQSYRMGHWRWDPDGFGAIWSSTNPY